MSLNLRSMAYWTLDQIKGSPVKRAYIDIKKIDQMNSTDPFIAQYQQTAWKSLKNHACATTPFYQHIVADRLEDFPVIDKNMIKQDSDHFLSSSYTKESLIQMPTSGSTGTPFICYQNAYKKRRVNAEIIYYSEKVGYQLGQNLSYIRTVVRQVGKSAWKQFLQNQTLIQCGHLDNKGIESVFSALEKRSRLFKCTVLAYGSTYAAMKDYIIKHNVQNRSCMHITGLISGSDMLYDETRSTLMQYFNCNMVSRYSNEENGVIGQDEGINNIFSLNEADYIVEILDQNGCPVPDGTIGRIVVTDLFNYGMPLIRYDTGDAGAIKTIDINGRKKRVICNFVGRMVDMIFDTQGRTLSPHVITNNMWKFTQVRQFQFIQTQKMQYRLRLNIAPDAREVEAEILKTLREIVGENAMISVEYVEQIPALKSGKFRYVMNDWQKGN